MLPVGGRSAAVGSLVGCGQSRFSGRRPSACGCLVVGIAAAGAGGRSAERRSCAQACEGVGEHAGPGPVGLES